MVGEKYGNLRSSVFFLWSGLCTAAFVYAYFLVPETKGLSLEQIDTMMEETTPRTSSKWKPTKTFASGMVNEEEPIGKEGIQGIEKNKSVV